MLEHKIILCVWLLIPWLHWVVLPNMVLSRLTGTASVICRLDQELSQTSQPGISSCHMVLTLSSLSYCDCVPESRKQKLLGRLRASPRTSIVSALFQSNRGVISSAQRLWKGDCTRSVVPLGSFIRYLQNTPEHIPLVSAEAKVYTSVQTEADFALLISSESQIFHLSA